jgi:5-methylcytosine-specific restriction protein A
MAKRPFRGEESYQAEQRTRLAVGGFLRQAGFVVVSDSYSPEMKNRDQIIKVEGPSGSYITMRVKLCWPKFGTRSTYAASQIIGHGDASDWPGEVAKFWQRSLSKGIDHFLFIQRDESKIVRAALFHGSLLAPIWSKQKDMYERLIQQRGLGGRKANPAINGSSPTLYLEDDNALEIETTIWDYPGVVCLETQTVESEYDNTSGVDFSLLGCDTPKSETIEVRHYKRSEQVRRAVLSRAQRCCEREGCGEFRNYDGFLDVHHILGISTSDRTWTCIALCPNCHREAHCSPNRGDLNRAMTETVKAIEAARWKVGHLSS